MTRFIELTSDKHKTTFLINTDAIIRVMQADETTSILDIQGNPKGGPVILVQNKYEDIRELLLKD